MLRRFVSVAGSSNPTGLTTARRLTSDSLGGTGSGSNNNQRNASSLFCDTADGVYTAMMMGTATAASASATKGSGRATRSVFGDSPAAIATSLVGCCFFATTYGYYIGGAVKDAAMSKFVVEEDKE